MAQAKFTKQEAAETQRAVNQLFTALTKQKQREFLGHLNDILLFLAAAKKAAPPPGQLLSPPS